VLNRIRPTTRVRWWNEQLARRTCARVMTWYGRRKISDRRVVALLFRGRELATAKRGVLRGVGTSGAR